MDSALISHSVIKSILQISSFSLIFKKQKASLSFGSGLPSLLPYVLAEAESRTPISDSLS